jgi:hypothetical protein
MDADPAEELRYNQTTFSALHVSADHRSHMRVIALLLRAPDEACMREFCDGELPQTDGLYVWRCTSVERSADGGMEARMTLSRLPEDAP